jgi:hypothetical protein
MKPILMLAAALFLLSAPPPDAGDIAEMTANFIVPKRVPGSLNADQAAIVETAARHSSTPASVISDAPNEPRHPGQPETDRR